MLLGDIDELCGFYAVSTTSAASSIVIEYCTNTEMQTQKQYKYKCRFCIFSVMSPDVCVMYVVRIKYSKLKYSELRIIEASGNINSSYFKVYTSTVTLNDILFNK